MLEALGRFAGLILSSHLMSNERRKSVVVSEAALTRDANRQNQAAHNE